jgi:hypothetical protein
MTRQQLTDAQIEDRFLKAKPGRKPLPAAPALTSTLNMVAVAEDVAAADQLIELRAGYIEDRDLANQILGQIQMARAISKFTDVVSLQKLKHIKENKIYRVMKGKKGKDMEGNEIPDVGTFDGFCRALGTSASKVDEDLKNLDAFGEEALSQLTQAGAGYRELRQYRRLPEDQKLALIEVARLGDKEGFVELAEEIIAKHAREKERATEDLETKDVVLKKANERINSLEFELARKFKPNPSSVAQDEAEQALVNEINDATLAAHHATRRLFMAADKALDGTAREAIELAARQAVEYLSQQLVDISTQFGIAVNFESRLKPAWMSDEMLEAMEARNAQLAAEQAATKAKPGSKPKLKSVQGAAK